MLAAIALGRASVDEVGRTVRIAQTFRPDPATRATYDGLYAEFGTLYKQNKAMYSRLNRADH